MNGYPKIIFIEDYMRKTLFSILIISVLSFILLLGIQYGGNNLASLFDVIVARVTINPLEVEASAPAEVEIGKVFKVTATLINKGGERIENAKGEIHISPGLVLLRKESIKKIGVIPGKKEKKASWSVRAKEEGTYFIMVSASGELRGYGISAEDSIKVVVKESLKGTQPQVLLQSLFDFIRGWFGYK